MRALHLSVLSASALLISAGELLAPRIVAANEPIARQEAAVTNLDDGYPYAIWTPESTAAPASDRPLVIWLHGFSLRGDDLTRLKSYGPPAVLDQLRGDFILVAPQLPSSRLLWDRERLEAVRKHVIATQKVDESRVMLIGASLGAAAAYDWCAAAPDRFAGLVVLAGAGKPQRAKDSASVPTWIFHGADDRQVPLAKARVMEQALQTAGGTVKFTELAGVGHDAEQLTKSAFLENRALDWLLEHRRGGAAVESSNPSLRAAQEETEGRPSSLVDLMRRVAEQEASLPKFTDRVAVPSNQEIYAWIEGLCATPHRRPGSEEGKRGEAWVADRFRELGLNSVSVDPLPIQVWQPQAWELTVDGVQAECTFLLNSGFTDAAGVTAPLYFAGEGGLGEFRAAEARGKIVVVHAKARYHDDDAFRSRSYFRFTPSNAPFQPPSHAAFPANMLGAFSPIKFIDVYERAREAGAVGFLMLTEKLRAPGTSFYWPYDAQMKSLPGLYVGRRDSVRVETAARAGRTAMLKQTGDVVAGTTANVWGVLPGASDDVLLITSHHDSPYRGAVEDASGIAQVLAQAWSWSRVPRERRPMTLVFAAAAGHFYKGQGAYEFAKRNSGLFNRCRAVVTLEHMPGREVRFVNDRYEPTGRTQPVVLYMPEQVPLLAAVRQALRTAPPPFSISAEKPILSTPLSDAAGYVYRSREKNSGYPTSAGVPYVSWISAPLYLVDADDTLDKIVREELAPLAQSVTQLVGQLMLLP